MSGIYIKGMEMPAEPGTYEIRLFVREDGTGSCWGLREYIPHEPLEVIPVPDHGRLVDADAIPYKKIMLEDDDFYYGVTQPYIDRMPTVIPADEEDEA